MQAFQIKHTYYYNNHIHNCPDHFFEQGKHIHDYTMNIYKVYKLCSENIMCFKLLYIHTYILEHFI